jgi:hypothetical protein
LKFPYRPVVLAESELRSLAGVPIEKGAAVLGESLQIQDIDQGPLVVSGGLGEGEVNLKRDMWLRLGGCFSGCIPGILYDLSSHE